MLYNNVYIITMYNVLILNSNVQQSVLGQLDIHPQKNRVGSLPHTMFKS